MHIHLAVSQSEDWKLCHNSDKHYCQPGWADKSHYHGVVELTNDLPLLKHGNEFVHELPKAVSGQMSFHAKAMVNHL